MTLAAEDKLLFGTAGVPSSIPESSTLSGINHVAAIGLDCLEIEFVMGNRMGGDLAKHIREKAKKLGIFLSVHAPYFINLISPDEGKRLLSQEQILTAARLAEKCGADSVVIHCGYYGRSTPSQAFEVVKRSLSEVVSILRKERSPVVIRPETMGKRSQFGTLEEILFLCREIDGIKPCLDFSHVHAREGRINSYAEFIRVFKKIGKKLGDKALQDLHLHISGVEYNQIGELRHLNLQESDFRYDEWIQSLKDIGAGGRIICESPDQAFDASMLKNLYNS
ncbi:MAG: TIM barrel protein [Acidobacteriota bacterium]